MNPLSAPRLLLLIGVAFPPLLQALIALPARANPWQPDPVTPVRPQWELAPTSAPEQQPATALVWSAADDDSVATAGERRLTWLAVDPGDTDPATAFSRALARIGPGSTQPMPVQAGEGDHAPKTAAEALALARSLPPPASSYLPLLRIGLAVPTANQLESEGIQVSYGQIASPPGGQSIGTGNQNYYVRLDVGLTQRLQLSGFYSVADDPLFARIPSKPIQPANKWQVFGGAAQWNLAKGERWSSAITASLEQFQVGSGGSDSSKRTAGKVSSNIFNDTNQRVQTNNVVGSIGFPLSWQVSRTLQLTFTPGASFLPSSQGAGQGGAGTFYGSSFTLATGLSWRPAPQLTLFASGLLPLGPGNNSFDRNLSFSRVPIYTAGLNYAINPRISLEGAITNGFGASPATALLALPSQEQLLYTGRFVYSLQEEDSPPIAMGRRLRSLASGGVTVNTALVPPAGSVQLWGNADSLGNLFGFAGYSASNNFQLQLISGGVFNGIDPVTPLSTLFASDNGPNYRYGGKAMVFSQQRGSLFTGGGRITVGRNQDPNSFQGYTFAELMGTWEATPWLALTSNPKVAWNGSSTPYGIGLSANVQLGRWFQFIPEVNLVASEKTKSSGSNYTAALRWLPSDFTFLDLYVSNAAGLLDIGQLLGNSQVRVGGRLTLLF